ALVAHYCHEKYYNHAVMAATGAQRRFTNQPVFSFLHSSNSRCHNRIGADKRQQGRVLVKEDRKTASPKGLYYAGMFLWLLGRNDKAREYVERMIKLSNGSREEVYAKKSVKYFDEGLKEKPDVFALMGKAQYYEYRQNYSGALEVINQVIKDVNNLEALRMLALHSLCRDGDITESVRHLSTLISNLNALEPHNPEMSYKMSLAFTRTCGRSDKVLQLTSRMVERAISQAPRDSELATELGHQMVLQGRTKEATKWYKTAMTLDETSVAALIGIIRCQLIEGQLEEAELQLGSHRELLVPARGAGGQETAPPGGGGGPAERRGGHHTSPPCRALPLGVDYLEKLNPDFLLDIVTEYLGPVALPRALYAGQRDMELAQRSLQRCLDQSPSHADAHLLMAQIHLLQGNSKLCSQSLELCLSHNFEVRERPLYHLIKAQAQKKAGELSGAIQTLQMALSLPGVRRAGSSSSKSRGGKKVELSPADAVSIFLELAEALWQNGEQELRLTVANADLALLRGDTSSH
ncbi:hypothetical protein CRUP_010664, partial [Coryphaenoides rupestris]